MTGVLFALLLGGVGSIQVAFPERANTVYTVKALQDGVVRRERIVAGDRGQVVLEGLPEGRYDIYVTAVTGGRGGIV